MKKIYMHPEMEIVEIKYQQTLLAGSAPALGTEDFETEDPILAPGLDVGPSLPGMPGFVFE
jgi:hypothetical protein